MKLVNPIGTINPPQLANGINEATVFTANGNFTPKVTANYRVQLYGGGGGGGGGVTVNTANTGAGLDGQAGGAGAYIDVVVSLTAGTPYAVVVGGGGAGGGPQADGSPGVASTFNAGNTAAGGNPGFTNIFVIPLNGIPNSVGAQNGMGPGGGQGARYRGNGGIGNNGSNSPANSGAGGGGGSGAFNAITGTTNNGGSGGNGGSGLVIVTRA